MRFVPYIGSFIAAFFPVVLAIAIDPGWTMVLLTAALFISPGLTTTLPKRMWTEAHHSVEPTLAAVSTILIVMVILVIMASELLKRRELGQERG